MSSNFAKNRANSLSVDRFSSSSDRRRSSSSKPQKPLLQQRPVILWTHEPPNFSTKEVVLSPDYLLPHLSEGELLRLSLPAKSRTANGKDASAGAKGPKRRIKPSFVFRPANALAEPEVAARQSQLQISISKNLASIFGFHNRAEAVLTRVSKEDNVIDHVELYFRDQYVGRADMWRFVQNLEDTCVYCGQKIVLAGSVRATIGRIFIKEKKVASGYVATSTKAIFRSESAKYNLFIQLAREMWEFDEDGEVYYEKAIQGFIPELLKRWRSVPTNHVLSITLFSRVHYDESELPMLEGPIRIDGQGRWYMDFYKVIVDLESNCDWSAVMTSLKEEFFRFQHDILLLRRPVSGPAASQEELHADLIRDRVHLAGRLSYSHEGNLLEAINLALNPFDEHYIDRDLNRTGLSIVFVTAGTGHFEVDKRLLRITTERMIENGIGLDLVCLTKMPLHSVPLFHFKSHYPDQRDVGPDLRRGNSWSKRRGHGPIPSTSRNAAHRQSNQRMGAAAPSTSAPPDPLYFDAKRTHEEEEDFYSMPHWVDCSFYNLQQDKPFRADRFVPRCKMYEVQMMGIMENQISDIAIPFLDLRTAPKASSVQSSFYLPRHLGPSGSGFVPDPAASGLSDLAMAGLLPKEQRRLARERFDREVFADVEPANKGPAKAPSTMIESPMTSDFQRSFERPELRRTHSSGFGKQSISASSISPTKPGTKPHLRSSRLGRESSVASSGQESQPASPVQSRFALLPPTGESAEETQYVPPTRPTSQVLHSPTSRPASIRSTNTFPRGLRLLEPIGKAKALVAPTDAVLSATSHPLPEEEDDASAGRLSATTASATAAFAQPSSRSASLSKASSPARKGRGYGITASWLWSSLTGGGASTKADTASNRSDIESHGSKEALSTPATRRIQEVLSSQLRSNLDREKSPGKRSVNSSGILSRTSSLLSVHEAAHPAPIKIPSQMTATRNRQEAEAEERILRDQDAYEQQLEEEEAKQRFAQRAQVEKQTLVNPSNPSKNLKSNTSQLLRWQHLFPRRLNHHVVKWRSMTTPACLPLTTLYLPTEADLLAGWNEHPHTTSVSSETFSFLLKKASSTHPALAVLQEMTYHRLAQGYQFIVPANKNVRTASSRKLNDPKHFSLRWPSELLQPGNLSTGNPIFLSMSNQIHRISYDRQAGAINVKRYVRRTEYNTDPIEYECCVWPRNLPGYQTVKAKFHYPDSASYNWTYLDSLIAGYVDERFVDSLRYWRTRFVLVPSEGSPPPMKAPTGEDLDDEEIRLLGTDKLAELFHRARHARSRDERDAAMAPRFLPTSLDPAMSLQDEEFMRHLQAADEAAHRSAQQYASSSKKRQKNTLAGRSLELVAKDMRSNGLVINDRLWHRMTYADIFTGADFVTWMCQEYSDVQTREEAVEWGMRLMEEGLFEHFNRAHGFLDGHYFYRLTSEYGGIRSAKTWFRSRSNPSDDVSPSRAGSFGEKDAPKRGSSILQGRRQPSGGSIDSAHPGVGGHSRQASQSHSLGMTKRKKRVQLSRSLIIDVDPGRRSDRAEVAFLHHDVAHNPDNGFNFQIHWLGTTARFIEDIVQNWTRTVERYGLRLIEAPIGQIKDVTQHNPFQAPVQIELSLPPPHPSTYAHRLPPNTLADQYFEYALLRRFGFILDQEASHRYPKDVEIVYSSRPSHFEYSQFVHRSGVGFVQVLGGKDGFLWLNNRLFTSHLSINSRQSGKAKETSGPSPHFHGHHQQQQQHQQQQAPDADRVRREFTEFCADPLALERFYRQTLALLFDVEKEAAEQQRLREERFRAEVQRELEVFGHKQAAERMETSQELAPEAGA